MATIQLLLVEKTQVAPLSIILGTDKHRGLTSQLDFSLTEVRHHSNLSVNLIQNFQVIVFFAGQKLMGSLYIILLKYPTPGTYVSFATSTQTHQGCIPNQFQCAK